MEDPRSKSSVVISMICVRCMYLYCKIYGASASSANVIFKNDQEVKASAIMLYVLSKCYL